MNTIVKLLTALSLTLTALTFTLMTLNANPIFPSPLERFPEAAAAAFKQQEPSYIQEANAALAKDLAPYFENLRKDYKNQEQLMRHALTVLKLAHDFHHAALDFARYQAWYVAGNAAQHKRVHPPAPSPVLHDVGNSDWNTAENAIAKAAHEAGNNTAWHTAAALLTERQMQWIPYNAHMLENSIKIDRQHLLPILTTLWHLFETTTHSLALTPTVKTMALYRMAELLSLSYFYNDQALIRTTYPIIFKRFTVKELVIAQTTFSNLAQFKQDFDFTEELKNQPLALSILQPWVQELQTTVGLIEALPKSKL